MAAPGQRARPFGAGRAWIFSTVVVGFACVGFVRVAWNNRAFVAAHPETLLWVVGAVGATVLVFRGLRRSTDLRTVAPWLGYGVIAGYLGIALQAGTQESLLRGAPHVLGTVGLALTVASTRTFAAWLVLRFVRRLGGMRSPDKVVALGLALGLGSALAEVCWIGENMVVRRVTLGAAAWGDLGIHLAWATATLAIGLVMADCVGRARWAPGLVAFATWWALAASAHAGPSGSLRIESVPGVLLVLAVCTAVLVYARRLRDELLELKAA